jgi:ankyrin repeat protein
MVAGKRNETQSTLGSFINSVLPISSLSKETFGQHFALQKYESIGFDQAFAIMVYLIANCFPAGIKREKMYELLQNWDRFSLPNLREYQSPAMEALWENLFKLSVEAEDVKMVSMLLRHGVPPCKNICMAPNCHVALTSLQFASVRGNLPLATVLIEAIKERSEEVDDYESGWKCSVLVLAIHGFGKGTKYRHDNWGGLARKPQEDDDDVDMEEGDQYDSAVQILVKLIRKLIEAGADPNFETENTHTGISPDSQPKLEPFDWMYSLIVERHTALTMASKYRTKEVVDILLENGATVEIRTTEPRSALRECLWSCEDQRHYSPKKNEAEESFQRSLYSFDRRNATDRLEETRIKITGVVYRLLEAEAPINCHTIPQTGNQYQMELFDEYSILDMALLLEDKSLARALLLRGAESTIYSMKLASDLGDFGVIRLLVNETVSDPTDKLEQLIHVLHRSNSGEEHANLDSVEPQRNGTLILAAIRFGATEFLKTHVGIATELLNDNCRNCLLACIEDCCYSGHADTIQWLFDSAILPGSFDSVWLFRILIDTAIATGDVEMIREFTRTNNIAPESLKSWHFNSAIPRAMIKGNRELALLLIDAGADVNYEFSDDYRDQTPVSIAVANNDLDLLQKLVLKGAKVGNGRQHLLLSTLCKNILVTAIEKGNRSIIQELINAGADISGWTTSGSWSDLNGRYAEDLESIMYNFDEPMFTPLSMAIMKQDWETVEELRQRGANTPYGHELISNQHAFTPLWAALDQGNLELAQMLVDHGANPIDVRAIEAAIKNAKLEKFLISEIIARGHKVDHYDVLQLIVRLSLSTNIASDDDNCASILGVLLKNNLIDASATIETEKYKPWGQDHNLLKDAQYLSSEVRDSFLRFLLDAGADPNQTLNTGGSWGTKSQTYTPLITFIETKDVRCVQHLLDAGATINNHFPQNVHYSPVQLAAKVGQVEIMELLLQRGGDPNIVSPWSQLAEDDPDSDSPGKPYSIRIGTPLQLAVEGNHVEIAKMLLKLNVNVDATTPMNPHTTLQIAARQGNMDLVEILWDAGANVNSPPAKDHGATALQFAAIGGYFGIAKFLVENGANVNAAAAEVDGRTAFEGAAEHGRIDMVQFLKNAGADISESSSQLERAFALATSNGHFATKRLLEEYLKS